MKKLLKIVALSVATFVVILFLIPVLVYASYEGPAVVATDNLNVREGNGFKYEVFDCLPRGTKVYIISDAGYGWYYISYNGNTGYVAGYYLLLGEFDNTTDNNIKNELTVSPEEEHIVSSTGDENGYITGDGVFMRFGPSMNSYFFTILKQDTPIFIRGRCGDWYEISYDNQIGYVYNTYVMYKGEEISTTTVTIPTVITPKVSGQSIVSTATNYLGMPYVWGGDSFLDGGFDCSGLVYSIYQDNGIRINRVAQDMSNNGIAVRLDEIQPGDILLFGSSVYNIWHVGIYTGNGTFIHSPGGSVVKYDSLNNIYGMRLVGARRIVQ